MTDQPAPPPPPIPEEQLKSALTAFRKRLKFTRLDQESKLGAHRPMTGGKKSDVMGIVPPNQFPPAVWRELARLGRLKDMGGGFYGLP
jgi:hypothetical protein